MTVEQLDKIDFANVDKASGDLWFTISDHLPWDKGETGHLVVLQDKLNAYLRFIESGEVFRKLPEAKGRSIIINLVGKYPLSQQAESFLQNAGGAIERAGFRLRFDLMRAN
jgi:hypothetical protein